jgi:predicted HAD superfamily hydrolase
MNEMVSGIAGPARLRELLADVDAVSFDVFDTLFVRPLTDPEDLFDAIGAAHGIEDFRPIRQEAQRQAFRVMLDEQRGEITLAGIYDCLPALAAPAEALRETETALELEATLPNREMVELYRELVDAGRTVVLTSDMYFQADFFEALLARHGLPKVPLFISADCNMTKRDRGALFDHVARTLGLPPNRILHIGDNKASDVVKAAERGFRTFHYDEPRRPPRRKGISGAESLGRGLIPISPEEVPEGSLHELGFLYGGPAATGFLDWIAAQAERDRIDHILFVARDGHALQQLAAIRREAGQPLPPSSYLLGSRVAFTLAAMNDRNFAQYLPFLTSGATDLAPDELLVRVGVPAPAEHVLADLGLAGTRVRTEPQQAVVDLLDAMRPEILKVARRNRRGLFRHLLSLGLTGGERVAFVDIGWNGTTQEAFEQALSGLLDLKVTGYYLCLTDSPTCAERRRQITMRALVEPSAVPQDFLRAIYRNRTMAEFFFSAPHGPVIGYRDGRDGPVPIEDAGRVEAPGIEAAVRETMQGMTGFAERYADFRDRLRLGTDPFGLAMPFLEFVAEGTWNAHPHLAGLRNFDSWAMSRNRDQLFRETAAPGWRAAAG